MSKCAAVLGIAPLMLVSACAATRAAAPEVAPTELLQVSDVAWEQLNPARGDRSPKAGTLWGDRGGSGPTGFLVSFVDGFSSPPHIHNVSYRGVVISGLVHNDDPDAAPMWMPRGSFWTQPGGEVHITAAKGSSNVAYIEIESGPYLVLPVERAFDSGERPVNIDASNVVWVDPPGAAPSLAGPQVAYLWGRRRAGHLNGMFVKLPASSAATLRGDGSTLRAVVIRGRVRLRAHGASDATTLEPGSTFASSGPSHIAAAKGEDCIVYVRTSGALDVLPVPPRSD